jgi:hypothetical protein
LDSGSGREDDEGSKACTSQRERLGAEGGRVEKGNFRGKNTRRNKRGKKGKSIELYWRSEVGGKRRKEEKRGQRKRRCVVGGGWQLA